MIERQIAEPKMFDIGETDHTVRLGCACDREAAIGGLDDEVREVPIERDRVVAIPAIDLAYFGPKNYPILEPGEFEVMIADQKATVTVQ